jgi:hypothetical protein
MFSILQNFNPNEHPQTGARRARGNSNVFVSAGTETEKEIGNQ